MSTKIQNPRILPKETLEQTFNKRLLNVYYPLNKRLLNVYYPLKKADNNALNSRFSGLRFDRSKNMEVCVFEQKTHYPELYAKPHNGFNFIPSCSQGFVKGICSGGHQFAKLLLCGREWCPDCGAEGSMTHKRRIARWWGKVMQMEQLGYLVITVPRAVRKQIQEKKALSDFRTYVKRKLQRLGYDRGLIRYHWAGEDGVTWHPHLNILIEELFMPKKVMSELKRDLCTWFANYFDEDPAKCKSNMWYSYTKPMDAKFEAHKIHKLKYITRSTLTKFNPAMNWSMVKVLKRFRATSTWGKWDKTKENNNPLVALESGLCPHPECRKPITWEGGKENIISRRSQYWQRAILKPLEGGYYQISGILPNDT